MQVRINLSKKYRELQTLYHRNIIKLRDRKIVIIIGCGRSGTTFSSVFLNKIGLQVGHERLLLDGVSSWYLVSDFNRVPLGPSFSQLTDLNSVIIHQVRHPIRAISSMLSIGYESWEFISREIPIDLAKDSEILKAMKYYYFWNLMAERKADFLLKVEEFEESIYPILRDNCFHFNKENIKLRKNVNTRSHDKLMWSDLDKVDYNLSSKIQLLASKYGYQVDGE